ncbi:hypothetical protein K503DRAFT_870377 [Rhizopogon vinicolor AM-OR11-026]|uniref:Uncharacterized protein n=1 Tax=Rhizopogon vinicolor AM-OR11-026 TaxID=1314800 RepID=A0A1B7MHG7_9AGAM|nr:hypothetical protein K503DRAFT_870377 [Rhizopogon vinicolor AM-OR11-026]
MPPLSAKAWEKKHTRKRKNGTILRRNPGRGDGSAWKSRGFICTAGVEDDSFEDAHDAEDYNISEAFSPASQYTTMFSIFDDARVLICERQRKAKSRLGDFEILESNPKVIAIEDGYGDTDVDEWEKLEVEDIPGRQRRTYCEVLQEIDEG